MSTVDTRPMDVRVIEAIAADLNDHGVKGATVALVYPTEELGIL